MADICLLKKNVFELIAAGEVVTSPFCVVKELVENSIDANSTHILVEIKNGGKNLIRVVDNGIGIKNKQCKLAFLTHSTSKIKDEEDLNKIKTLGFRGEALSSIAAVSKVLITTKTKKENLGCRFLIEGSLEKEFDLVNCSDGTTIEVRDIFFNVPARLKFLKSDSKEASNIQDILEKLALSNPNISFDFKKDGKKIMQTYKSLNKKDIIFNIYGKEFCDGLIDLNLNEEDIKIEGFITDKEHCKSYKSVQHIFVNSRYVKSKNIANAIEDAYSGIIEKGKYPCFIIYINVPLNQVDVNVHPNKTEVRFSKEKDILNKISFAVREAIFKKMNSFLIEKNLENIRPADEFEESFEFKSSSINPYKSKDDDILNGFKYLSTAKIKKQSEIKPKETKIENLTSLQEEMFNSIVFEEVQKEKKEVEKQEIVEEKELKFNTSKFRVIGEIFKLYILAEFEEDFIIIDKHAAHERIIYEKIKQEKENLKRQILISPIKILLGSSVDCDLVLQNKDIFLRFGFLIDHFEGHYILIREVPLILASEDCREVFEEMVSNLKNKKKDLTPEKLDSLYSLISCKAAIKKNHINSKEELKTLAEKVYFNPQIRNCPHSRPVIFIFKKERFDKKFERK